MSKDKNFERRMIVSKYSNRPPFDLKKPKETCGILDKIKEYPIEGCKKCCRNMTKSSKNTLSKPSRNLSTEDADDTRNISPGKRAIPKIIETFQKLNLSQDFSTDEKTSIQTLFRNTRSCKLGKNIPKHKLMKSLLQNFDSEVESCKKCSGNLPLASKERLKYKKSPCKKQLVGKNEDLTCENYCSSEFCSGYAINNTNPPKFNKKTSTTGLVWPPASKEVLQYSNNNLLQRHQLHKIKSFQRLTSHQPNTSSHCPIIKEHQDDPVSQFSLSSFLEETPTKEVPSNYYIEPTRSEKLVRKNVPSISQMRQKSLEDSTLHKKPIYQRNERKLSPKKLKSKEKTFVQTQVEKLNKVMKNTKIPGPILNRPQYFNGGLQKRGEGAHTCMGRGECLKRDKVTSNYMDLMNKIRSNVPRIQKSDNYDSFQSDNNDWSDFESEINPEYIRFPKETKTAVDQRLCEKKRIPLSKFTMPSNNFKPAILLQEEIGDIYSDYYENPHDRKNQDGYKVPPPTVKRKQRSNKNLKKKATVKPTVNIPCQKKLLCDKGEQHLGPCGYTHNRNKVIY